MAIANITGNILTDSGVATSSLLPLTGGTLTGTLTVNNEGITINRGAGNGYLLFQTNATDVGSIYSTTGGGVRLRNATSDVLTINSAGNVGISTSSPVSYSGYTSLHIAGAASTGSAILYLTNSTSTVRGLMYAEGSANRITFGSQSNHDVTFVSNDTSRMAITSGGQIFMYNLSASAGTNAARYSTSTGQLTYDTSSERYKNNIRNSIYGLNDIMKLRSTMFEYKEDERTDIGLIAEEVYEVIPELVGLDKDGLPNSVSYDRFVSVLVKAIQELNDKVSALENKS